VGIEYTFLIVLALIQLYFKVFFYKHVVTFIMSFMSFQLWEIPSHFTFFQLKTDA